MEGKGVLKYVEGDVYNGEFRKGLVEGKGVLKFVICRWGCL